MDVPADADARTAAIEEKAREIYNGWKDMPGWVPWVEGGNSHKQGDARNLARAALDGVWVGVDHGSKQGDMSVTLPLLWCDQCGEGTVPGLCRRKRGTERPVTCAGNAGVPGTSNKQGEKR
jgi:hypothetical protein